MESSDFPIVDENEVKFCKKFLEHSSYISHKGIRRRKYLPGEFKRLSLMYELVDKMVDLTGLLVKITDLGDGKTASEGLGCGNIVRIRRRRAGSCPCRNHMEHPRSEFAIITVATNIHVFTEEKDEEEREDEDEEIKEKEGDSQTDSDMNSNLNTDEESENRSGSQDGSSISFSWNAKETGLKLNYSRSNTDINRCPTLYGYTMIENDKDDAFKNDWCATEFTTHDMNLVQKLERSLKMCQERMKQLYELRLQTRFLKSNLVIIVGHPHNLPIRVSVGKVLSKETLKEVRTHQRWCRYKYRALTCRGSSGSAVYIFGQPLSGFGYWFGHPHNHSSGYQLEMDGEIRWCGISSIGVEAM